MVKCSFHQASALEVNGPPNLNVLPTPLNREINNDQDHVTLQEDLDNLNNWANKWQLNFNFSKCNHLGITNKRDTETYSYMINNQIINRVSSTKYLGITITHNLNSNKHCDMICGKAQ